MVLFSEDRYKYKKKLAAQTDTILHLRIRVCEQSPAIDVLIFRPFLFITTLWVDIFRVLFLLTLVIAVAAQLIFTCN